MAAFRGVVTNRLNGGLNRRLATNDGVCLLVVKQAVQSGSIVLNEAKKLFSLANAEEMGINASYDDNNSILAHHHIDEFFRLAPNGTLYVLLTDAADDKQVIAQALREHTEIKGFGVVNNAPLGSVAFAALVVSYQNLINDLATNHILVDYCLLEGNNLPTVLDFINQPITNNDASRVSVVIGADPLISKIQDGYAAIGSVLGMLSVRRVNESLGSVDIEVKPDYAKGRSSYSLTDKGRNRWLSASLQNGTAISSLTTNEKAALENSGYIFAGSYSGFAGIYFTPGFTATLANDDYHFIENNRVWNKSARALRTALLPRVLGNLLKDPTTGYIREIEAKELEALAQDSLQSMEAAQEISGFSVFIDPKQELTQDVALKVQAQIVANSIVFEIAIDLGLTNQIT